MSGNEKASVYEDRDWWRRAGDVLDLELRGWTFRLEASFADRETGRIVELTGAIARRLLALTPSAIASADVIGLRARCEGRRKLGISDGETEGDGEEMATLTVPLLMLERVLAAIASAGGGEVVVKPLEWHRVTYGWLAFEEWYRIEDNGPNWTTDRYWLVERGERLGKFDTVAEARAAMQTRHEARIRSALATPPAPAATGAGLVEAAGWLVELRGSVPSWAIVNPNDYDEHWTTESASAIRFARKVDAEAFIAWHGWTEAFASEHIWDDGRTVPVAASVSGLMSDDEVDAILSDDRPLGPEDEPALKEFERGIMKGQLRLALKALRAVEHYLPAIEPYHAPSSGLTGYQVAKMVLTAVAALAAPAEERGVAGEQS